MIKLIATDMDGTLLNNKKELPSDFYEVLDELKRRGIHMVIASGRSYITLKLNFDDCMDKLDFICDNGAYVIADGKNVGTSLLDNGKMREMLEECRKYSNTEPVLCGRRGTYFSSDDDFFVGEIRKYYPNFTCVDDICKVEDDIFKVAVCDRNNPEFNSYKGIHERFGDIFNIQITGCYWMDIMNTGVNKGAALQKIQKHFGIAKEETMAFGDYFNDVELLQNAEYGFVMENAHKDMFAYGKYRAQSNENSGVTKAIREMLLDDK